MPNVTIRNVPPDVHAVLSDRAAAAGQSLQQYLLGDLTERARQPTMTEVLERIETRLGRQAVGAATGAEGPAIDAVASVHAGRAEREAHLAGG